VLGNNTVTLEHTPNYVRHRLNDFALGIFRRFQLKRCEFREFRIEVRPRGNNVASCHSAQFSIC